MLPPNRSVGTKYINFTGIKEESVARPVPVMSEGEFKNRDDPEENACSVEDKIVMKLVENSTNLVDGRYAVRLPWRKSENYLRTNYVAADRQLESAKGRLLRDCALRAKYSEVTDDCLRKVYANGIEDATLSVGRVLPRHPVLHPAKSDKLLVVSSCVAKYDGCCLNGQLIIKRILSDRNLVPAYDDSSQLEVLRPNDLTLMNWDPGIMYDEAELYH